MVFLGSREAPPPRLARSLSASWLSYEGQAIRLPESPEP
jgi:hypothetical protein